MPIVIAENFQNDTLRSLMDRYPGTHSGIPLGNEMPNAFPLMARGSYLQFGEIPFNPNNNRFEVTMAFPDQPEPEPDLPSGTLNLFGLRFQALANKGGFRMGDHVIEAFPNARSMNIIVDRKGPGTHTLTILIDGEYVLSPSEMGEWYTNSWIGFELPGSEWVSGSLPHFISSIVVAVDTTPGTIIKSADFITKSISLVDAGAWEYSDSSYEKDVDKDDPTEFVPNVHTVTESTTLTYEIEGYEEGSFVNLYAGGFTTDPGLSVSVNDIVVPIGDGADAAPVIVASSKNIDITSLPVASTASAGKGIIFYGEVPLIGYTELFNEVVVDPHGSREEEGNLWLHFRIDGKELYIAKTSARSGISWGSLYLSGLVYGIDGPGPYVDQVGGYPPTDQNKTVEIGGKVYKIRLPKGADVNPSSYESGISNAIGSRNSEWTRLFAAISARDYPDYSGPRLASYTDEELGVGGRTQGYKTLCQESLLGLYFGDEVCARGNNGDILHSGHSSVWGLSAEYAWRPVLELVTVSSPRPTHHSYYNSDKIFFSPDEVTGAYTSDINDL